MESSRVFVKNLPPAISEAEFRKHFSAQGREVTDVKLIPNRRIGFVGYKSHEDAAKAVKYFNRSFIRMSRIGVDLAKPIADSNPRLPTAKDSQRHGVPRASALGPSVPNVEQAEDESSKKRKRAALDEGDHKLQEYLEVMGHPTKRPRDQEASSGNAQPELASALPPAVMEAGESDDEYEDIPTRGLKAAPTGSSAHVDIPPAPTANNETPTSAAAGDGSAREAPEVSVDATDDDWLRSRTSRLLDLVDPDDPGFATRVTPSVPAAQSAPEPQEPARDAVDADFDGLNEDAPVPAGSNEDVAKLVERTSRLFLRNLSYNVTEDDVRERFAKFGNLEESKGFAMIRYEQPAAAVDAFQTDGSVFQGRIIHILPASAKRENKLDEFAISKLPLKKQQLLKKKAEAASSSFNWNSLFMSQDAVNTAMAERLGVSKHELLDPTDASAAVKQAVAETTVIQEAKAYFATHGVNIEAFKSQQRGDTSILVKNIRNASIEELRTLFEEHGAVLRVLMPPSGTIAIVQFAQPAVCRAAFAKKAYSRFKESVLFLEKGPKGLFVDHAAPPQDRPAGVQKPSVAELLERDDAEDQLETASLFVRNLNFSTTTEGLTNAFKPLDGFVSAKVKTKTDPKKPGQVLSMGFGFCAFKTKEQAQAALKVMDGYVLDAHKLLVKASHRGHDAAEERRREDLAKKAAAQRTKVVVKNLPFEASKKDVRALFSAYGKLVALRLPKKFNHTSRGFAFAEFSTAKEALNALTALKDTHLLGRRLVLDFAEADEVDPEEQIKAMEKKIRGQVNKVTLQELTGEGRKREALTPFPLRPISSCVGLILFACLGWPFPRKQPAVPKRSAPTEQLRRFSWGPPPRVWIPLRSSWAGPTTLFGIDAAVALGGVVATASLYRDGVHSILASVCRPGYVVGLRCPLCSTMELQVGLPVLSAQCYSPSPDHEFEGRRAVSSSRQPLQESTGNIQHPHMAWYAQHLEALSSIPSSIPPVIPPVLRTQSLGPDYGAPSYARSQQRHELHSHGKRRAQGSNPLMPLLTKDFQNYRKKQEDKPDQKWPEMLEGFFLDGRSKYTMKQQTNGRNQLIGEYLWIACCHSLSPGEELDPHVLEVKAEGGRKKVSSHIQVLRNFFSAHRCFHFLFGPRQRDKEDIHVEKGSLKNNPVLIALSEGRILALNEQVQFRPKRCWIFVSHPDVVIGEDGSGYLPATDSKLRETWAKEEQQLFKGALLHEFTKEMHQVESSSVNSFSKKWESAFPDLQQRLKNITSATTDAKCDILHLHATLELKEKRSFPAESSLSSWVEINIEQPRLLNHRWRVETRLDDSHGGSSQEDICERHKEFTIKYQHQPGHCDCLSQRSRRDGVSVPFPIPFPATAWAQTLTNCAEYPAHPFSGSKRHERERGAATKAENDDEDGRRSRRRGKQPTQMDLVPKIAMMQEVFSCPPTSPHEGGTSNGADQRWTRRAVILWTFETIHSVIADKNKKEQLVTAPSGRTNWRFLTILDPAGEHHQRQAVASNRRASADEYRSASNSLACASRPASRAAAMSPSPTYQQHLGASVNENFHSAWDNNAGLSSLSGPTAQAYGTHFMSHTMPSHTAVSQGSYSLLDSFSSHSGLATPPPSASMASSFAQPFDTASASSDMLPSYMVTHGAVTTAGMDPGSHSLGSALSAVTDPFLSHVGAAYGGTQDGIHGWDSHSVAGSMDAAASWSSGYSGNNTLHSVHNGAIDWSGPQQPSIPSRRGSEQQHQPHSHHRVDRQPWAPSTHPMDDHGTWTPIPSETTRTTSSHNSHRHHHSNNNHPRSHHHHDVHNEHEHTTTASRTASQEWAHTHTHASSTGSGSDISQDWEEMHALAGSTGSAGHTPQSPDSLEGDSLEGHSLEGHSLGSLDLPHDLEGDGGLVGQAKQQIGTGRGGGGGGEVTGSLGMGRVGLKRRWEGEGFGDEGGDGEGDGGYRRLRARS
ncbi:uncharacterized protein B0H64DRAFT_421514 [Chaetomium fimeti]|uniref:Multiple RNA-binding domain-containing protein 1 n=1 Tax=Chaetomium fimeti TaxID=1854472 RepID=A0AAE0LXE5_9PEZI|nr:hypothetical protein B0H64DRAFT_421514 [Chaetomium fimeti]